MVRLIGDLFVAVESENGPGTQISAKKAMI